MRLCKILTTLNGLLSKIDKLGCVEIILASPLSEKFGFSEWSSAGIECEPQKSVVPIRCDEYNRKRHHLFSQPHIENPT